MKFYMAVIIAYRETQVLAPVMVAVDSYEDAIRDIEKTMKTRWPRKDGFHGHAHSALEDATDYVERMFRG